ncbi:hypothetical protein [Phaeobacter sp. C3_T13_0]|uniref:hypothetical protein n=1 Tax=Phaeobacter cretensis TaxID=3342641 RepID=UPI0039BC7B17
MPNVMHMWCVCGHVGTIKVPYRVDHAPLCARARCLVCGRLGQIEDIRLGWTDDASWELEKRTKDSGLSEGDKQNLPS